MLAAWIRRGDVEKKTIEHGMRLLMNEAPFGITMWVMELCISYRWGRKLEKRVERED